MINGAKITLKAMLAIATDNAGQDMVEYCLILALISLVCMVVAHSMANAIVNVILGFATFGT
jgi:Flp pilus assembly pilin Flp